MSIISLSCSRYEAAFICASECDSLETFWKIWYRSSPERSMCLMFAESPIWSQYSCVLTDCSSWNRQRHHLLHQLGEDLDLSSWSGNVLPPPASFCTPNNMHSFCLSGSRKYTFFSCEWLMQKWKRWKLKACLVNPHWCSSPGPPYPPAHPKQPTLIQ